MNKNVKTQLSSSNDQGERRRANDSQLQPTCDPAVRSTALLGNFMLNPFQVSSYDKWFCFRQNLNKFCNFIFHFLTLGLLDGIVSVRLFCRLNDKIHSHIALRRIELATNNCKGDAI